MRYFLIAGEQSGDLHGSNLVKELIKSDPGAVISCWGGDLMESAGATLLMHYRKTAFMGFLEVLKNLKTIAANLSLCKQHIQAFNPDVVIMIDYPGFNLRMAGYVHNEGYRVYYYISPKVWAWKENRVVKIRKYVDRIYIIFPFEVNFYRKHNIKAVYRGNPLLDETEKKLLNFPKKPEIRRTLGLEDKPVIALLAGSRKNEVAQVLPEMLKVVSYFPDYQFVLAGVKNLPDDLYRRIIGTSDVKLIKEKTYEILYISQAALVTSGTATLETALLEIPQVVCFRGDFFSMLIAWIVVKVKYISLVNLILGREAVRELVQYSLNAKSLRSNLSVILPGGTERERMLSDYRTLKEILGPPGASARIAEDIVKEVGKDKGEN